MATEMEGVLIAIYTAKAELAEKLHFFLRLWAEEMCVQCLFVDWDGETESWLNPIPSLLFTDYGSQETDRQGENERLNALPSTCAVVMLSNDQQQAIQAYQWHPVTCLAPGFSYRELSRMMDRCFRFWRQGLTWLDLPSRWDRMRLPICQIRYAEGKGRETILHCAGGDMVVNMPLSKIEVILPSPPFIRCQKGYIVHPGAVKKQVGGELIMKDNYAISITRSRQQEIRGWLMRWHAERGVGEP